LPGWVTALVTAAAPTSTPSEHGRVWAQTPAAGTALAPGATVNLSVAP
jgi:hypothetical protein